jgi:hypothetical protein
MDPTVNRPVLGDRIEASPVDNVLSDLDLDCQLHAQPLRLELGETTVGDIYDPDTDLEDMTFDELTLWSPYKLDDLMENLPQSLFTELPHRYDRYEVVDEKSTVHFRFDVEHPETRIVPTSYNALQLEIPTFTAYVTTSLEHFAEQEQDHRGEPRAKTLDEK